MTGAAFKTSKVNAGGLKSPEVPNTRRSDTKSGGQVARHDTSGGNAPLAGRGASAGLPAGRGPPSSLTTLTYTSMTRYLEVRQR